MTRLAIFDCDGTLVDSGDNICRALARSAQDAGRPVPPRAAMHRIIGLSLHEAMAELHPDVCSDTHARLAEGYKDAFVAMRAEGEVHEPLFDGIADVLASLLADGWTLGVATGKSDRGLQLCLERHGLADHFVTLQTADRHPSKPHPSMVEAALAGAGAKAENAVLIGDTSWDILMARAAGVRAVGVAWGYHSAADLHAAGAHAVVARPEELLAILKVPA